MDINSIINDIEQFRETGGNMGALDAAYRALCATGVTPNIGLNQWQLSDKPTMEDFNEDNRKVDEEIGRLNENKADINKVMAVRGYADAYFGSLDFNDWHQVGIYNCSSAASYVNAPSAGGWWIVEIFTSNTTKVPGFPVRQVAHGQNDGGRVWQRTYSNISRNWTAWKEIQL